MWPSPKQYENSATSLFHELLEKCQPTSLTVFLECLASFILSLTAAKIFSRSERLPLGLKTSLSIKGFLAFIPDIEESPKIRNCISRRLSWSSRLAAVRGRVTRLLNRKKSLMNRGQFITSAQKLTQNLNNHRRHFIWPHLGLLHYQQYITKMLSPA